MRLRDSLELALGNLRLARLRTALTTSGVGIGVGALVGMVSFGEGLQQNLSTRLLRSGLFQTITVFPQADAAGVVGALRDQPGQRSASPPRALDGAALAEIRQIPGVRRAEPDIRLPLRVELGGKSLGGIAIALPMESREEAVFREMPHGAFFSAEDAQEIILGTDAAKSLGYADPKGIVGKTLRAMFGMGGPQARRLAIAPAVAPELTREFKVVGLVSRERAIFGAFGSQFYLPYRLAEDQQAKLLQLFPFAAAARANLMSVAVRLDSPRSLDRVEKEIGALGFRTISIASAISQLRRVFLVIDTLLALFGGIGLAVACLGITNTMVMAVLERTREIGVMKAVGAEDQDISRLFLAESAVIGAVGGALGLVLAWALAHLINAGANVYFARQGFPPESLFAIRPWLILAALAFAVVVSMGSGLYPAVRAARIDPTRALRHD